MTHQRWRVRPGRTAGSARKLLAVAAALVVFTVTACGGGGSEGGGDGGPVTLRVGVIPIADVAPLYLGRQQGFFEAENIKIEPQTFDGGAAILPALQSGDLDIGFSNTVSLLIASSKGLPVRIIAQGVQASETAENAWSHIWVRSDSDIREPKDLEGKTISLNTLKNVPEVTARRALEKHGVDLSKVNFTEVPFPDAQQALDEGQVDAIYVVEPFDTVARDSGARPIVAALHETEPSLTVATYFTMAPYLEENREVVEGFNRAMNKSLEYAANNPEAVRKVVGEYTKTPKELLAKFNLPQWNPDLNRPSIELMNDLSVKYGLMDKKANLDELIWAPGANQG